jgi:hypothetical protein
LRSINKKPKLIDGSPKIFAAKLGFLFSTLILLFTTMDYKLLSSGVGIMLILFALLEGTFNFCVGCKIYSIIESIKKTQHN